MEPDFERRLIRSLSGQSSLSSSPFSSTPSSPSPIKHSDRFIPLRSLSQPSAFFIDQEQIHRGPSIDKKSSRDPTSLTNTNGTSSSNGTTTSSTTTTVAADRTKDILTYQALLQNEMFGSQIDSLYDEYHMNSSYSNGNSNHSHTTVAQNPTATNDPTMNAQLATTNLIGQHFTTSISGINVKLKNCSFFFLVLFLFCL